MRWGCVALFVLVARVASADPLADAKTQVAASDYLKARVSLDEAFASGTNGPEQLAEIWRLRGIVAGALDETKVATDAFQRCLALSPKADLPPGTSPKITRPFTAAQDFFKKNEPLGIKQEAKQDPPSIAVLVTSDPLSMIARLQVSVKVDGATEKVLDNKFAGQEQIDFALPAGARLDLRVAALDEKGNRLAELGSADVPIVIVGKPVDDKTPVLVVGQKPPTRSTKPPAPVRERAFVWKWWLWGGGAVLFAGAATYFGVDGLRAKSDLEDLNADSPNHSFDEAKDLESRAKRDFLFANIGYGVAGALAITATILFLTEPDQPSSESRVTAVPVEGGAALVFGGQF